MLKGPFSYDTCLKSEGESGCLNPVFLPVHNRLMFLIFFQGVLMWVVSLRSNRLEEMSRRSGSA